MDLLSKEELIEKLKENGENEGGVSDSVSPDDYMIIPFDIFLEDGCMGFFYINVKEGLLRIPYNHCDWNNGCEQLILGRAEIADPDELIEQIQECERKYKFAYNFASKYLKKKQVYL